MYRICVKDTGGWIMSIISVTLAAFFRAGIRGLEHVRARDHRRRNAFVLARPESADFHSCNI